MPKWRPPFAKGKSGEPKSELKIIFVIMFSSQGQSMNSRKDADLRSVMQSREEALREVEKLVQHTETLEKKYTDKVITTFGVKEDFLALLLHPIEMMVLLEKKLTFKTFM